MAAKPAGVATHPAVGNFDLTAGSPERRRDPPSALSFEGALVV
jgi:hypothetical protein